MSKGFEAWKKRQGMEKMWNEIMDTMDGILMLSCVVLHERYGFGEKRLMEFIEAHKEINHRFAVWARDEVWDDKTKEWRQPELRKAYRAAIEDTLKCCLPADVVNEFFDSKNYTYQEYAREMKKFGKAEEKKMILSVSEEAEMREKLAAYKQYLESGS